MRRLMASAALGLVLVSPQAWAEPGDEVGATVKVVNVVTAELEQDFRNLATGDGVRQEELISVGPDGLGELKLLDETKLALGPGSKLKLDKYVYDSEKTSGSIVVNLVKGTFRFVTGLAHKPTYVIKTPSAAITVRGTIFDLFIDDSEMTWLLLIEGGVKVCNTRGKCRQHDEPGKIVRVSKDGDVGVPIRWAGLSVPGNLFDLAFPFIVAPPTIDPDPILTRDGVLEDEPQKPKKTRRTEKKDEPKKTGKKKAEPKPKKTKQAAPAQKPGKKLSAAEKQAIMDGVGIAIGIAGGIKMGGGKNKHKPKPYPKPDPGHGHRGGMDKY